MRTTWSKWQKNYKRRWKNSTSDNTTDGTYQHMFPSVFFSREAVVLCHRFITFGKMKNLDTWSEKMLGFCIHLFPLCNGLVVKLHLFPLKNRKIQQPYRLNKHDEQEYDDNVPTLN